MSDEPPQKGLSKRERRRAAALARERSLRRRQAVIAWIAAGIWFVIMFVFTLLGREGLEWTLLWVVGGAIVTSIAMRRTVAWRQLRQSAAASPEPRAARRFRSPAPGHESTSPSAVGWRDHLARLKGWFPGLIRKAP